MSVPALLIANPASGGADPGRRLQAALAALEARYSIDLQLTRAPDHATELAAAAARQGCHEVVFACGGDGTLREVAAGLLGSDVPMGILANGTTNVLALALGLPRGLVAAARAYAKGTTTTHAIDVGLCDERPFLMMASAGVDASALRLTGAAGKRRWGRLAVLWGGLRALRRYGFPRIRVALEGRTETATFVAASNIRYYGGPFTLSPDAEHDDGALDALCLRSAGRFRSLAFAAAVACKRHLGRADVTTARTVALSLDADEPLEVQIDGDSLGLLEPPVAIRLATEKLQILLPAPV